MKRREIEGDEKGVIRKKGVKVKENEKGRERDEVR